MMQHQKRKVTPEMSLLPEQCRAARALLGWSQAALEETSKVAKKTIADFERGARTPYDRTLADIRAALESAGVEFIAEDGGGAGVRLKKAIVRLISRRYDDVNMRMEYRVFYINREIQCGLPRRVLDTRGGPRPATREQYESAFDRHENAILARTQQAIDAGRVSEGVLQLTIDDFP